MTKQEAAIKYITENYLDFNTLRHDIVSDKLQIRMADSLSAPHNTTSVIGDPAEDADHPKQNERQCSVNKYITPKNILQQKNK